ncbi:hypothetical protein [Alteromonas gracilis]|uniref:hypothetical protein n=1 Tax=Alteromonas gracilis TaxID=1479524 RepID=UPI003735D056
MHQIITTNGIKQLANVAGQEPHTEPLYNELNKLLEHGVIGEEAVAQWVTQFTDLDFKTTVKPLSLLL